MTKITPEMAEAGAEVLLQICVAQRWLAREIARDVYRAMEAARPDPKSQLQEAVENDAQDQIRNQAAVSPRVLHSRSYGLALDGVSSLDWNAAG